MRRVLGTELRKQFEKAVRERLPGFVADRTTVVVPGSRVWRTELACGVTAYLVLFIHPRRDDFMLEGAWSVHGRFPSMMTLRQPRDIPRSRIKRDAPINGEFRLRIPYLWQDRDYVWQLVTDSEWREYADKVMNPWFGVPAELPVEPALSRIPAAVEDAISKTVTYYLPYLESVVRELGGRADGSTQ